MYNKRTKGTQEIDIFVFGIKFVTQIFPVTTVIAWLSVIAIIYGSLMAIAQDELKRMLAYSSISQIGYIGLGIGLANAFGIIGAVLHILNHGLMKACFFLVAGNLRTRLGHSHISRFDDTLRKKMPWTLAAFVVGAMAMIGIPPTVGFFSKWYLLLGAVDAGQWPFVVALLICTLINVALFFRIFDKGLFTHHLAPVAGTAHGGPLPQVSDPPLGMLLPALLLALVILLVGIFNQTIVNNLIRFAVPAGL